MWLDACNVGTVTGDRRIVGHEVIVCGQRMPAAWEMVKGDGYIEGRAVDACYEGMVSGDRCNVGRPVKFD